jgi:hypothetical protein
MRHLFIVLVSLVSLYANELVYISNDANEANLEKLYHKYNKTLLINDSKVYLIPSKCLLERYYGGASQGNLILATAPQQTQKIVITQEVFEAKDESTIKDKIEVEKSLALIEGKAPKAFLDDKEGRGFGGASELPLDFSFQKLEAKKVYMKPVEKNITPKKATKAHVHPTCQLLEDGSGYRLEKIKGAKFYKNKSFQTIENPTIVFK